MDSSRHQSHLANGDLLPLLRVGNGQGGDGAAFAGLKPQVVESIRAHIVDASKEKAGKSPYRYGRLSFFLMTVAADL